MESSQNPVDFEEKNKTFFASSIKSHDKNYYKDAVPPVQETLP